MRTQREQRTQRRRGAGVETLRRCLPCVLGFLCVLVQGSAQSGIRIGVLSSGSYTVTVLPLDAYVARVLAGEAAPNTAPAALEALAIAVRTYTAANMGKHRGEGFDLCDQTHCQVMRTANADTERASKATAGLVLFDGAVPATIYYSASCGGRTELPSAVWPGSPDPSYLPSREDDACRGFPAWSAELAAADLQRALATAGYKGTLRNMRIASRNGSGRVDKLVLEGMTPSEISGQDLRMAVGPTLGWLRILSASFDLRRAGTAYRFAGRGSGHGVGMCVIGAMHRAEAGETATSILAQYYPGLRIAPYAPAASAPSPPVTIEAPPRRPDLNLVLPTSDAAERGGLESFVARARDELSRTLAVDAPPRLTATFHATAAEYEKASGHPWFTSGALVDGSLHFLPASVLRDRGVLERTVRRGLVALMTASSLAGRPLWIREGIAGYFADPQAPIPETRQTCPTDAELARPVSAGALSDAYARARACVARQVAGGRLWRDVR
jgi:SpoIID/LytB domain protein